VLLSPGQYPDEVLSDPEVTLVNMKGRTHDYSWRHDLPVEMKEPAGANIHVVNLKSRYKPFYIVSPEPFESAEGKFDAPFFRSYSAALGKNYHPDSVPSIYGWWNWSRIKDNRHIVLISKTNKKQYLIASFFFLLTIGITFFVYKINLDHLQIPNYIDIFTSGIFFTAMWLMANKKIESWIFWIVGDIITVPLYSYRGLGILSLQYLIFLILAIQGYYEWKKTLNKQSQTV
jgi:nicotinamide mononucleotide transporter PnuC